MGWGSGFGVYRVWAMLVMSLLTLHDDTLVFYTRSQ